MRNCFVPGCDAFCKKYNMEKRKMFLPPAKFFAEWAAVLPNKRPFKKHDRVCERHFEDADIIKFWEANINGHVHVTPRDKPKLRENACPCKNLPSKGDFVSPLEDQLRKRNDKVEILTHQIVNPSKRKEKVEILSQEIMIPSKRKLRPKAEAATPKKAKESEMPVMEIREILLDEPLLEAEEMQATIEPGMEIAPEMLQKMLEMFESLYDEAFDVTLPSLLWGIHRDPDRKFIVFSEFNQSTMSVCKLLHINDNFIFKTFINNSLTSSSLCQIGEELVTDHVSAVLDELDKGPLVLS